MTSFVEKIEYKPKSSYLAAFLKSFWFIPSDVLQRSMEANIWGLCSYVHPILEIGIGNGKLTKSLFSTASYIDVGIDIEESGLETARTLHVYKKVESENAENMSFPKNAFNTVISNSTFEHIHRDIKAVSEVSRVLKKGGLFFITVPSNYLEEWIFEYEKIRNKQQAKKRLSNFNKRANHLHYRSLNSWKKILQKNNLEIIVAKYYFPKDVALFWYKLFCLFTTKKMGREIWSWIGDSRLTPFIPKSTATFLGKKLLKNAYERAFFTTDIGAQLFIIAKKK